MSTMYGYTYLALFITLHHATSKYNYKKLDLHLSSIISCTMTSLNLHFDIKISNCNKIHHEKHDFTLYHVTLLINQVNLLLNYATLLPHHATLLLNHYDLTFQILDVQFIHVHDVIFLPM